jgi:hypothetical protein
MMWAITHWQTFTQPAMPNRVNWANQLAYTEWTTEEIGMGLPWKRIRERLLEKYIK